MANDLILRRQGNTLVPVTDRDLELLQGVPHGKDVSAKVAMFRSGRQHRFLWALLSKVVENCDGKFRSAEHLHIVLKHTLGLYEEHVTPHGEVITTVASTSYRAMDGIAFKTFLDGAINVILTEIFPGMKQTDLLREVESMIGIRYDDLWSAK